MEEYDPGLFVCHVLMDGNDVDLVLEQRFQDGLQFIFRDCEISINDCIVVVAGYVCEFLHSKPLRTGANICRSR
jgi:hypothetical protein